MRIVINTCYGGFGLSREAFHKLREMGNKHALKEPDIGEKYSDGSGVRESFFDTFLHNIPRDDPDLIKVVEEIGAKANTIFSKLKIVEIPDGVDYEIGEYDGVEWVAEEHRTWS